MDLHTISANQTQEKIIGGIRSGVLHLGDSVTFRAQHFGVWQTLTSKVTAFEAPVYFCDEMQRGAFKRMRHEHHFEAHDTGTLMRDVFEFASPLGWLGSIVDALVLKRYLRRFLVERGRVVKHYAESGQWREVLPAQQWPPVTRNIPRSPVFLPVLGTLAPHNPPSDARESCPSRRFIPSRH